MVLNRRIDRRPRRSESAPTIGEKMNPMPEYTASSIPVVNGEAPNRSAYSGSTGMTMPKPTISMKTVKSKIGSGDKSLLPVLRKRLDFIKRGPGLEYAPSSWSNQLSCAQASGKRRSHSIPGDAGRDHHDFM